MKRILSFGIAICAAFIMLLVSYVPAGAVAAPDTVGNTAITSDSKDSQENDSAEVSGIEPETPSAKSSQTRGKADIEKSFPISNPSAADNGKNSADKQVPDSESGSSQEMPIVYEQQQDKSTTNTATSTDEEFVVHPWNNLLLIAIAMIAALLLIVAIRIKRIKK